MHKGFGGVVLGHMDIEVTGDLDGVVFTIE
jgi:hypothetical protein